MARVQRQSEGFTYGEPILWDGYYFVLDKEHPQATKQGYIRLHRLIWEKYHKAILLPWAIIHHINGIKTDNRIENLDVMSNQKHTQLHKPITNKDNRKCVFCQSMTTSFQTIHISGKYRWYRVGKYFSCDKCYKKLRRGTL